MKNNIEKGAFGEDEAVDYLEKKGYQILNRNYRCKIGEIDIICKLDEYIVFVEVKYRKTLSHGYPRESVTKPKQKTIKKVSLYYIVYEKIINSSFRYDVIEILGDKKLTIEHIENAFW